MQVLDSVLLVDDDEVANNLHKNLIEELGLARNVVSKKNGKEAFHYIEHSYRSLKQLPSLVLVDLAMPVMDGYELISELQQSELLSVNKIPLAIVSSVPIEDRRLIDEISKFDYILKPLDEIKFLEILHSTVFPTLSDSKQNYINTLHQELEASRKFLRQQHTFLNKRREEIKKLKEKIIQLKNKLK
jgi:CheY-like chemotaxis protein